MSGAGPAAGRALMALSSPSFHVLSAHRRAGWVTAVCLPCILHPGTSARPTRLTRPRGVATALIQSRDRRVNSAVPSAGGLWLQAGPVQGKCQQRPGQRAQLTPWFPPHWVCLFLVGSCRAGGSCQPEAATRWGQEGFDFRSHLLGTGVLWPAPKPPPRLGGCRQQALGALPLNLGTRS